MDTTISTETLNRKANASVTEYLTHRGYTILEQNWGERETKSIDLIAIDDGAGDLVFVDVQVESDVERGLPAEHPNRARFEQVAASYLSEHPSMRTVEIRFDIVSLVIVGDGRAFLRHHRSALSSGD